MILSNRNLINWQIALYIAFISFNALGVFVWAGRAINRGSTIEYDLYLINRYSDSIHQLLNLTAQVLLLILLYRLNRNVAAIDRTRSYKKIWIFIHWFVPVFHVIYPTYLFKNYLKVADQKIFVKRIFLFRLLNSAMVLGVLITLFMVGINIISSYGISGETAITRMMFGKSFLSLLLLLYSILFLVFLKHLKQVDYLLFEKENPLFMEQDILDR